MPYVRRTTLYNRHIYIYYYCCCCCCLLNGQMRFVCHHKTVVFGIAICHFVLYYLYFPRCYYLLCYHFIFSHDIVLVLNNSVPDFTFTIILYIFMRRHQFFLCVFSSSSDYVLRLFIRIDLNYSHRCCELFLTSCPCLLFVVGQWGPPWCPLWISVNCVKPPARCARIRPGRRVSANHSSFFVACHS